MALCPARAFDPTGWETASGYPLIGDPGAQKGGTLNSRWSRYVPTLRTEGPNSNLLELSILHNMVFESLLTLHPETLEYVPRLASHWKISPDKRTFKFRIDPRARWSDGTPVTAEDVVETWKWLARKDIKDPYYNLLASENFELPAAESPSVVSVRTKKLHWRLFFYFGAMINIYPAKEMRKLSGEAYLKDYNWKLQMGSGPYEVTPDGIKKEHSVTIVRRKDYWAEGERWNIGANNFDRIAWYWVEDDNLAYEKFKKGEFDWIHINRAQRWAEETEFDKVRKGWIKKRKIYTQQPEGFYGYALNMRKPPFDDRDVRKAFAHLYNRERLIDKLFFNQYAFLDSYFPGDIWGSPENPKIRYNPRIAARLLARAGYKERDKDGWLVGPDGKPFEITLEFRGGASSARIHKVVQEDLAKAGIKLNLKELDTRTLMKKVSELNFTLHSQAWTGSIFPNPTSMWGSKLADEPHSNNTPGFKDPKVDALCEEYDRTFDRKKQIELMRRIDRLIFRRHPYALAWYGDFDRILFWDKFGHPRTYFTKIGNSGKYRAGYPDILSLWWKSPEHMKALESAMAAGTDLPRGETVQKPWARK